MAAITRSGTPSLADPLPIASQRITKPAFHAIAAGDMLYIKSDDTLAKADGTAANAAAKAVGMAVVAQPTAGEPVTAVWGVQVRWGAGLTPGARYYLDTTAGNLADAATTGGDVPVAFAVDATRIFVLPPVR
jgi:hypothetical protein